MQEPIECLLVVGMPARQSRPVFYDISGCPQNPPLID
jgi:hypothetical protein